MGVQNQVPQSGPKKISDAKNRAGLEGPRRPGAKKMLEVSQECAPDCPVARTADIIGGKWTTLIIRDLLSGTKRYSQLQRSLEGISPRMLAMRLSMLEEHGLIGKRIYPTVPPKTEYSLTAKGRTLEPVIAAMAAFGMTL